MSAAAHCHDIVSGTDTRGVPVVGRVVMILPPTGQVRGYGLAPVDSADVCATWYAWKDDVTVIEHDRPLPLTG